MKALLTWRFWFTSPWWNLLRRKDYELAAKQFAFWAVVGMFFRLYLEVAKAIEEEKEDQQQAQLERVRLLKDAIQTAEKR